MLRSKSHASKSGKKFSEMPAVMQPMMMSHPSDLLLTSSLNPNQHQMNLFACSSPMAGSGYPSSPIAYGSHHSFDMSNMLSLSPIRSHQPTSSTYPLTYIHPNSVLSSQDPSAHDPSSTTRSSSSSASLSAALSPHPFQQHFHSQNPFHPIFYSNHPTHLRHSTMMLTRREKVGKWTSEEHGLFLDGIQKHGRGWKEIAKMIPTRSVIQIRTHAQKYFLRLQREKDGQSPAAAAAAAFTSNEVKKSPKRKVNDLFRSHSNSSLGSVGSVESESSDGSLFSNSSVNSMHSYGASRCKNANADATEASVRTFSPLANKVNDEVNLDDDENDAIIAKTLKQHFEPIEFDPSDMSFMDSFEEMDGSLFTMGLDDKWPEFDLFESTL